MSQFFPRLTPAEVAEHIDNGQSVAFSGFTAAGAPKAVPRAIAERAKNAHQAGKEFRIGVLTGASTGTVLPMVEGRPNKYAAKALN